MEKDKNGWNCFEEMPLVVQEAYNDFGDMLDRYEQDPLWKLKEPIVTSICKGLGSKNVVTEWPVLLQRAYAEATQLTDQIINNSYAWSYVIRVSPFFFFAGF